MTGDHSGSGAGGSDGGTDSGDGGDGGGATADGGDALATPRARAPWERKDPNKENDVRHSALVGFMSVPASRRFPIRRSTLLMVVAFATLATVLYFNPPQTPTAGTGAVIHTSQGDFVIPGATKVVPSTSTTTTLVATTTTTTRASVASTSTTSSSTSGTSTTTTSSTTTTTGGGSGGSSGSGTTTTTSGPSGQFGGTSTTSTTR